MPRIRTIKPEFWTDSKVVRLSLPARLLFIGTWNYADDYGALSPDAAELKLRVLPADPGDADVLVSELFDAGLLEVLADLDGRVFWHITNWGRHQRVNRPTDSEYGDPTDWKRVTRGFSEESVRGTRAISEDSEGKGKEGKGTERKGKDAPRENSLGRRDGVWDTLVDLFGEVTNDSSRGGRNRAVALLKQSEATPDEIRYRHDMWPLHFDEATLTDHALAKHYDTLGRPPKRLTKAQTKQLEAVMERHRRRTRITGDTT